MFPLLPYVVISHISQYLDIESIINLFYSGENFNIFARIILSSVRTLVIPIKCFLDEEQNFNSIKFVNIINSCSLLNKIKIEGQGILFPTHKLDNYFYTVNYSIRHFEISNIRIDTTLLESLKAFKGMESLIIVNDSNSYILFERQFIELLSALPYLSFLKLYNNNLFCVFDSDDLSDIRKVYLNNEEIDYHCYVLDFFTHQLK